jgi:putative transposase
MRADVAFAMEQFQMSERRACKLVDLDRSSYQYNPRPDHNAQLREKLVLLARHRPRYGYRRLHALLSRQGESASVQRVYRVYKQEGLAVRRLKRKRLCRPVAQTPNLWQANQQWSLDFVSDALATGRGIRVLTVVDAFTRECLTVVSTILCKRVSPSWEGFDFKLPGPARCVRASGSQIAGAPHAIPGQCATFWRRSAGLSKAA